MMRLPKASIQKRFQLELKQATLGFRKVPLVRREVSLRFQAHCTFSYVLRIRLHISVKKSLLTYGAELARCFGSDATKSAIENVWKRQVRPGAKAIIDTLNQGGDPKNLNLMDTLWTGGKGAPGRSF
jgi:hypothetical protein